MRTRLTIGMLLIALAAFAADKLQRVNVKTGLWEVTKTNTGNQMAIPPALMERMTPEQRARMEARLKAQEGKRSNTMTYKKCVTDKELDDGNAFSNNEQHECTQKIVSSTSTAAEIHITCEGEKVKGEGIVKFKAVSAENVTGSTQLSGTVEGQPMSSSSTFNAKWVSASCDNQ